MSSTCSTSSAVSNDGAPEHLALDFSVSLAVEAIAHCALVQEKEKFRPRLAEVKTLLTAHYFSSVTPFPLLRFQLLLCRVIHHHPLVC